MEKSGISTQPKTCRIKKPGRPAGLQLRGNVYYFGSTKAPRLSRWCSGSRVAAFKLWPVAGAAPNVVVQCVHLVGNHLVRIEFPPMPRTVRRWRRHGLILVRAAAYKQRCWRGSVMPRQALLSASLPVNRLTIHYSTATQHILHAAVLSDGNPLCSFVKLCRGTQLRDLLTVRLLSGLRIYGLAGRAASRWNKVACSTDHGVP